MEIDTSSKKILVFFPTIFILGDTFLSLYLQPKEYWQNHIYNSEWSPLFKSLLEISPIAFLIGALLYVILIILIICYSKFIFSIFVSFGLVLLHSNAILFWLINRNIISYFDFVLIILGLTSVSIFFFSQTKLNT